MTRPDAASSDRTDPEREWLIALCQRQQHAMRRTVDYLAELAAGPLDGTTRLVVDAVLRSLALPAAEGTER